MNRIKKVFAIVVTYNGDKWICKCLDSLKNSSAPVEIIVIDNDSTDETKTILKAYSGDVTVILSETNLGFGKANNKGIEIAMAKNADYIFLLNQDAWIEKNTISTLLEVAENNPDYGVISPVHLNGSYSGLDLNFSKQLAPDFCPSFYSDLYFKKMQSLYQIKFVNAAAWLVSKPCIEKVGFFEPMFFLYGEDNNYLQRATYHGFKIGITPLCTICHDREIRQGNFNERGIKIWERTFSLIILLNILNTYNKSIWLFAKERIKKIFKYLFQLNFIEIKCQLMELFFCITNFMRLHKIRSYHKATRQP
jgi:GT2 family glycosyltransferase